MTPERWTTIADYPDYEISTLGRVRSHKIHRGQPGPRILSPGADNKGYLTVRLCGEGGGKSHKVHTLVALAFLGPRPAGAEVRHLDGDNQNNRVGNLMYGTPDENRDDGIRHRTHCRRGHVLAGNSYVKAGMPRSRVCRTCQRDADARRRARRVAA